jgi:hypothetical protein
MLWGRHVAPVGSRGANTQFSRPWLRRHASYQFVSRKVAQRVEGYEGDDGRRRMGGEFGTFPAANVGKGSMILLVDPQLYRDGSESNSSAFFLPPPRYQEEWLVQSLASGLDCKHRSYTLARTTYLSSRRSDRRSVSIFRQKKTTRIMVHQGDESDSSSECISLAAVWYTDNRSAPAGGSVLTDPISRRLVSFDFSPARKIELIEKMLADRDEQQAAKGLELGEASRLVELLDLVRLSLSPLPPMSYRK